MISPYAGPTGGPGRLGEPRSPSPPWCSTKRPTTCPRAPANTWSTPPGPRAVGAGDRARRPSHRADRAGRLRHHHGGGPARCDRRAAHHLRLARRRWDCQSSTALFGLGTGLGLISLFTHVVDTPELLLRARRDDRARGGHRLRAVHPHPLPRGIRHPGPTFEDVRESVVQAIDTAGRAVLFAGCTVVIALLGMMLLGVDFLYGVAISASIGVLLVMLGSLTLLPALLTIAGTARRCGPGGVRGARGVKRHAPAGARQTWLRWSASCSAARWPIALAATLVMLLIAAPAIALRLGSSDATQRSRPARPPTRPTSCSPKASARLQRAAAVVAQGRTARAGSGNAGPRPDRRARARRRERCAPRSRRPRRRGGRPGEVQPRGDVATITVYPRSSPQAYATTQLVSRLRNRVDPAGRSAHRHARLRRRRHRRRGRLRQRARPEAAAVHRRRGAARPRCSC